MIRRLTEKNLSRYCGILGDRDKDLQKILDTYGLPTVWRRPIHYDTLAFIILEQQVSLSSARATYQRLRNQFGTLTATKILAADDELLAACSVTRQKRSYLRSLAECMVQKVVDLEQIDLLEDDQVIEMLQKVKGIGPWTCDIFLMESLNRVDRFPLGDVALLNALRLAKGLTKDVPVSKLSPLIDLWRPYRTVAAFMLWHLYLNFHNLKPPVYGPEDGSGI